MLELHLDAVQEGTSILNDNRNVELAVGDEFELRVLYDDLRSPFEATGAFHLLADVAVSQPDTIIPVMFERQRLAFADELATTDYDAVTFAQENLTFQVSSSDFSVDPAGALSAALQSFGYSDSSYSIVKHDQLFNGLFALDVTFSGADFENTNVPNITADVVETDPNHSVEVTADAVSPVLADGSLNPDAFVTAINYESSSLNGEEIYQFGRQGSYAPAGDAIFNDFGGTALPRIGGLIPSFPDGMPDTIDAFGVNVKVVGTGSDVLFSLTPSDKDESVLLFDFDRAIEMEEVHVDSDAMFTATFVDGSGGSGGNGTGDEQIELQIDAIRDGESILNANRVTILDVGDEFELRVLYDDLRPGLDARGAFRLLADIAVSQPDTIVPMMFEQQVLTFGQEFSQVPFDSVVFQQEDEVFAVGGNDFAQDPASSLSAALQSFGYTEDSFAILEEFVNGNATLQVIFAGAELANKDVPDITLEIIETEPDTHVNVETTSTPPVLADGSLNPASFMTSVNFTSPSFNNEPFYQYVLTSGMYSLEGDVLFDDVGGTSQPLVGGIPAHHPDNLLFEPFDAFGINVLVVGEGTNVEFAVAPGSLEAESVLLFGIDHAINPEEVLLDDDAMFLANFVDNDGGGNNGGGNNGGSGDELIELQIDALVDGQSILNDERVANLDVGDNFELRVLYDDLRNLTANGAFQLLTDIAVSQPETIIPVMFERQVFTFSQDVASTSFDSVVFGHENDSFSVSANDFESGPANSLSLALQSFGYAESDFNVIENFDITNGLFALEVTFAGSDLEYKDVPDVSVDIIETDPSTSIDISALSIAPVLADGSLNPEAFTTSINYVTPSFANEELYAVRRRGNYNPDSNELFDDFGGFTRVLIGGIPAHHPDGMMPSPFSAFGVNVKVVGAGSNIDFSLTSGDNDESILLHGIDEPITPDQVLLDGDAMFVANFVDENGGGNADELIELQIDAVRDGESILNDNRVAELEVGDHFELRVLYDDLRTDLRVGAFHVLADIAASQPDTIVPAMFEQQFLTFSQFVPSENFGSIVFEQDGAAHEVAGPEFASDPVAGLDAALRSFGYAEDSFTIDGEYSGNGDVLSLIVTFAGTDLANTDVPDISASYTQPDADTPEVETISISPVLADGGLNPASFLTSFNSLSPSAGNQSIYQTAIRGEYVPGQNELFDEFGALTEIPGGGGGIPELISRDLPRPFDAFGINVIVVGAGTDVTFSLTQGDDNESILLFGIDDPIAPDQIRIDEDAMFIANFIDSSVPVAADDIVAGPEDTVLFIDALANDFVPAEQIAALSVSGATEEGGTVEVNESGSIVYTPPASFHGTDLFVYELSTSDSDSTSLATVTVSVAAVNDAPVGESDEFNVDPDSSLIISPEALLLNDSPGPGELDQTLVFAGISEATFYGATVELIDGDIIYTPPIGFTGTDEFTYTISDGELSTEVVVVVHVVYRPMEAVVQLPQEISNDVLIENDGGLLVVSDRATEELIYSRPLNATTSIRVIGSDSQPDRFTVNMNSGPVAPVGIDGYRSGGLSVQGGESAGDTLEITLGSDASDVYYGSISTYYDVPQDQGTAELYVGYEGFESKTLLHTGVIQIDEDATLYVGDGEIVNLLSEEPIEFRSLTMNGGNLFVFDTLVLGPGAVLEGHGSVSANIEAVENAIVRPLGQLYLSNQNKSTSESRFAEGSAIEFRIGGTEPVTGYDKLSHEGTIAIDGKIDVQLVEGFAPKAGQRFEIFPNTEPVSVLPENILFPDLPSGLNWMVDQSEDGIAIEVGVDVGGAGEQIDVSVVDGELVVTDSNGEQIPVDGQSITISVDPTETFEEPGEWTFVESAIVDGVLVQRVADQGFELEITGSGWTNFIQPTDVDFSGGTTAGDAIKIINQLHRREHVPERGNTLLDPALVAEFPDLFFDINGDGLVSARDALGVINHIARALISDLVDGEAESGLRDALVESQDVKETIDSTVETLAGARKTSAFDGPIVDIALPAIDVEDDDETTEDFIDDLAAAMIF